MRGRDRQGALKFTISKTIYKLAGTCWRAVRCRPLNRIPFGPALYGWLADPKIVEVDNYRQRLARGQRGGGPSNGFHLARFSTFGIRERWFVFPFSVKDQCAVRPNRVWGCTLTNCLTILATSVASLARVILLGGEHESYVRN